ncbi:PH domain-containing protein [Nocardiopsis trehalosi]|uniref:PH domain-containing protein n=1 Tax=Nocardiopsis trehalosi TaxID=109329 RepID=UPI0012F9E54E|nr:PH domain-containing protein [Nocardiopsis trehalosi]
MPTPDAPAHDIPVPTAHGAPAPDVPPVPGGPGVPDSGVPAPAAAGIAPEAERALSPLTLVTAPIAYLRNAIVPLVVAVVAGSFNPWVLGSAAVAIAAMLVGGFVTWRTFRYQVGSERLEIRRGLISRSRRSIPLERIRGVDVTSHLLHRLLGLAVVRIDAAGGGGESEEGKLDAVTAAEAERLRRELLHRRAVLRGETAAGAPAAEAGTAPGAEPAPEADADEDVYFTMPRGWYLYAVLSLGYLLTPFVALATVLGFLGQVADDLASSADADAAAQRAYAWFDGTGEQALLAIAIGAAVVLVALMPVSAVVSYAIAHWGFTLRRRGDALVTERGLFTRRSVTLELRRVRGHELLDNPLERLRRAVRLRAVVTGLGDTATRATLLPIGPRDRVGEVVERALIPYRGPLTRHPGAALRRRLFRAVAPFAAAAAVAAFLAPPWVAVALAAVAALGVPLGVDRYRALGHGDDGRQVSVRSGSLRRAQAVVRRDAIIGWTWRQTLFQRRPGLAHLELAVGAGGGAYTAIDAGFDDAVTFAAGVSPELVRPFLVEGPDERPAP